ncbi:MAG: hypothetical protein LBM67_06870 [Lentimicrobiaceae bacterium]|jgi:hypothetical protein|nr:hypothetical protein [Lentimicrobiaceae bacterium]
MENQDEILDTNITQPINNIEEQKIINLNKFIVLCITSFGLYSVWWIYKAWRFYQQKENLYIMPAVRAMFSIFFLTSLFNKILSFAKEKGYGENFSSIGLFIGFIVGNLLAELPDPFWLISILSFVFLIPPFKALNYAKQNSNEFVVTKQTSFSGRQIGLIVVGIIFFGLVLLGLTMGDV